MQPVPPSVPNARCHASGTSLAAARRIVDAGDRCSGSASSVQASTGASTRSVSSKSLSQHSSAGSSEPQRRRVTHTQGATRKKSLMADSSDSEAQHSSDSDTASAMRRRHSSEDRTPSLNSKTTLSDSERPSRTHSSRKEQAATPRESCSGSLPDVQSASIVSGFKHSTSRSGSSDQDAQLLEEENSALKRTLASFEQQHRFMMSALDREFHLKIKEQEQQRAVLRSELDQVLKQLKFTQFEGKDKLAEANIAVEEERRKAACAQAQHEKAKKQRNQLVKQVSALRAEISRRDTQGCFDAKTLSDALQQGMVPASKACNPVLQTDGTATQPGAEESGAVEQMAQTSSRSASSGLTRDQLSALRQHVKTLAEEKLELLQQVSHLQQKWEQANQRAESADRLAAQLALVRAEREAALSLSSNILVGAFRGGVASSCGRGDGEPKALGRNCGVHKRPHASKGGAPLSTGAEAAAVQQPEAPHLAAGRAVPVGGCLNSQTDAGQSRRPGLAERSRGIQGVEIEAMQESDALQGVERRGFDADQHAHALSGNLQEMVTGKDDTSNHLLLLRRRADAAEASRQQAQEEVERLRQQLLEAHAKTRELSAAVHEAQIKQGLDAMDAAAAVADDSMQSMGEGLSWRGKTGNTVVAAAITAAEACQDGPEQAVVGLTRQTTSGLVDRETQTRDSSDVDALREDLVSVRAELVQRQELVDQLRVQAEQQQAHADNVNLEIARWQQEVATAAAAAAAQRSEMHALAEDMRSLQHERDELVAQAKKAKAVSLVAATTREAEALTVMTRHAHELVTELTRTAGDLSEMCASALTAHERLSQQMQEATGVRALSSELMECAGAMLTWLHELNTEQLHNKQVQAACQQAEEQVEALRGMHSEMHELKTTIASATLDEIANIMTAAGIEMPAMEDQTESKVLAQLQAVHQGVRGLVARISQESSCGVTTTMVTSNQDDQDSGSGAAGAATSEGEAEWEVGACDQGKTGGRPWSGQSAGRPSSGILSSAQTPQLGRGSARSTSPSVQFSVQEAAHAQSVRPSSATTARPGSAGMVRPPAGRRPRPASAHYAGGAARHSSLPQNLVVDGADGHDDRAVIIGVPASGEIQDAPTPSEKEKAEDDLAHGDDAYAGDSFVSEDAHSSVSDDKDLDQETIETVALATQMPAPRALAVHGKLTATASGSEGSESDSESSTSLSSMTREGLTPAMSSDSGAPDNGARPMLPGERLPGHYDSSNETDSSKPSTPSLPPSPSMLPSSPPSTAIDTNQLGSPIDPAVTALSDTVGVSGQTAPPLAMSAGPQRAVPVLALTKLASSNEAIAQEQQPIERRTGGSLRPVEERPSAARGGRREVLSCEEVCSYASSHSNSSAATSAATSAVVGTPRGALAPSVSARSHHHVPAVAIADGSISPTRSPDHTPLQPSFSNNPTSSDDVGACEAWGADGGEDFVEEDRDGHVDDFDEMIDEAITQSQASRGCHYPSAAAVRSGPI